MMFLKNNLEAFIYNYNRVSIKKVDNKDSLDIGESQLDFIFEFIVKRTDRFFFLGERLEYSDNKLEDIVKLLSKGTVSGHFNYHRILIELKPANLMISRKQLATLWSYYEYAAVIFLDKDVDESNLMRLFNSKKTYEEIAGSFEKSYLVYGSFEPNVLWIEKSSDMPDMHLLLGIDNR